MIQINLYFIKKTKIKKIKRNLKYLEKLIKKKMLCHKEFMMIFHYKLKKKNLKL